MVPLPPFCARPPPRKKKFCLPINPAGKTGRISQLSQSMKSSAFHNWPLLRVLTGFAWLSGFSLLALGADTPPPLPNDDAPVPAEELIERPSKDESPAPPIPRSFQDPPPAPVPLPGSWAAEGPGPIRYGQVENVSPDNEVGGAIHTVAAHPTDANILYIGAVNGGVWKTTNATVASPTWTAQTDIHGSLSIGALDFDPTDGTDNTLWAGIGRFSSFGRRGGDRLGLLRTINGGTAWTPIDGGGTLVGKNISGLAARGATVVVSVDIADSFTFGNVGIFRSTNSGASFTQIGSGSGAGTGLPGGICHDLAVDPSNINVLYTSVIFADIVGGVNGLYKSTDLGASWTKVSNAAMDADLISGTTSNVEITVGNSGQVFAGIVNAGQLRNGGVYYSPSGNGGTWQAMDVPLVNDVGVTATGGTPSPQWEHLTHTQAAGGMPGGGTASNSSPHADSREMAFDANGTLIEVDDGGVYRRTNPTNNTGDWFSINGNLQVTEGHAVGYDTLSNILITGNQDTGVSQQSATGSGVWDEVSQGDGGDVAVTPDPGNASRSIRYSSAQYLGNNALWRSVYNASGTLVGRTFPALTPLGGAAGMTGQFYTPLEANIIDPNRLLFGGGNGLYESANQGSSISLVSTSVVNESVGNPMLYGGRSGGSDNADLIYAAVGSDILKRTTSGGALSSVGGYSGGTVLGIIADTEDWMTLFAIDSSKVYQTTDGGTGFSNITGDLPSLELHSIEFIRAGALSAVVVGTDNGVYAAISTNFSEWMPMGTNLPDAPVWDMQYDSADDVLAVSLLGRGAWTFPNASGILTAGPTFVIDGTPDSLEACAPSNAVFNIDVASVQGFSDPVTLSLTGAPAGTSVGFSPNPVTPGSSSTLTIGNTGAASAGSYTIQIDGVAGVITRSDTVTLNLFTEVPDPVTLISPANGEIGVGLKPTLVWSADPLPVTYTVDIDDDPAFGSTDFTEVTANTTTMVGTELAPDTLFYWRVTAQNPCGSTVSGTGAFVTRVSHGNSPGTAIPDGTSITDDVVVADSRTIADLDVALKINHTYLDDEATLVAEDDWSSGEPAYIVCGHYQPNNVLSAFDGESLAGTWRLTVTDVFSPDPGTLVAWSLRAEQVGQPEIVVEQPVNTDLADGISIVDYGNVLLGANSVRTFTIRNLGTAPLSGLAGSTSGAHATDFVAGAPALTSLVPGQSTTFNVTFNLANNDSDENPFDVALIGTGVSPEIVVELGGGDLTDGVSILDYGELLSGTTPSADLVLTIRNTGTADLTGLGISIDGPDASEFSTTSVPATLLPGLSTMVTETVTDIDLNFRRAVVNDSVDGSTHPRRFGRVRLDYPPPAP